MRSWRHANSAKRTRRSSERFANLIGLSGSDVDRAGSVGELRFVQLVIAAQQHKRKLVIEHVNQCLDLAVRRSAAGKNSQIVNRAHVGSWKLLGSRHFSSVINLREPRRSLLYIGRVAAAPTHDDVVF